MADRKLFLWMTLAMLGWGASWPIAKILSGYITEHELVTYRYALTVLTMLPIFYWLKLSFKIELKNLVLAIVIGVLLIFYTKLFFLGTKYGTAGLAGALVTTLMPIIVYVLMLLSRQKKPRTKDWLALVLGVAGVFTMIKVWTFELDQIFNVSNVYLLWAALCWALMSIATSYTKSIHPVVLSFYVYLFATLIDWLVFFNPSSGSIFNMDQTFWLGFVFLAVGSTTFATTMYFLGVQKLGSNKGSVFTFLVPFFAIGLSAILLGELLQLTTLIGVVMTIVSLITLNNINFSFLKNKLFKN
ncbi:DMT family transporter [Candidatus Thioglobus sp.]|uniref:DMT family transporter n=1 Tax=Candidatus Thioglobus sp. TaxID=2026721 RepID=UPI0032426A48